MSDFFGKIAGGVENAQADFLGPTYNYVTKINSPDDLNMSSKGTMDALANDIGGLISYTGVLISGQNTGGSTPDEPLGNRYYLKVGGDCTGPDGNPKDRYIFVNNIPTGSIPFLDTMGASKLSDFKGLIPGTIENLGDLNPLALFGGFMQGASPACNKLNISPKGDEGKGASAGQYVANADIANLDGCLFSNNTNPVPTNCPCPSNYCTPPPPSSEMKSACDKDGLSYDKKKCYEEKKKYHAEKTGGGKKCEFKIEKGCGDAFRNINDVINGINNVKVLKLEKNPLANAYNLGVGMLLIYLLYRVINKQN